jgi:hypothetical protein
MVIHDPQTKPALGPDDTWPAPSPAWLPRDGNTLPSLPFLSDDRAIELDSDDLEEEEG